MSKFITWNLSDQSIVKHKQFSTTFSTQNFITNIFPGHWLMQTWGFLNMSLVLYVWSIRTSKL